ncbi:MAG: peptidase M28, partial [Candidatus Eisenbacteria bacterium]
MDATYSLLKELCETFGPPGHEGDVAVVMKKHLKGLGDFSQDGLGSVICKKRGAADDPRIMVAGHMDEVGFMVKGITAEGFIKFLPMGGWWGHVVLAQRVKIRTKKGDIIGVVGSKPPHELKEEERRKVLDLADMFIDVGATSYY